MKTQIQRCVNCKKVIGGNGRPNHSNFCYSCLHKLSYNKEEYRNVLSEQRHIKDFVNI